MPSGKDWPGEWADVPSGVDVTQIEENLRLTPRNAWKRCFDSSSSRNG